MITSDKAIENAFSFVNGLKPEYLGAKPENMRLETVQLFGKEWVVVLSYTITGQSAFPKESLGNALSDLLKTRRYIKELEINSESGEVVAMRNPESPVTTSELISH